MNRILLYLNESRAQRRRAAAELILEDLEARCGGLAQFLHDEETNGVLILVRDPRDPDPVPLDGLAASTVLALREHAASCQCLAAELESEGGDR